MSTPEKRAEKREYDRLYRQKNREKDQARHRAYYLANTEKVLAKNRHWRDANPERTRELAASWTKRNPERVAEYQHRWYMTHREEALIKDRVFAREWRHRNLKRHRATTKAWIAANPERYRAIQQRAEAKWIAANPERRREIVRRWEAANPENMLLRTRRRRARLLGASGSHTAADWREKCVLFANLCAYCGKARPLTADHKIPLSRGGSDDITNIVPACGRCNSAKHTQTSAEFISRRVALRG